MKPKLRFKGYDEDWEEHKLSEFLIPSLERNINLEFDKNDVLSVSGDYGCVNQIEYQGRSFAGSSLEGYDVIDRGDVVYTKSPLKNQPYGIIKSNSYKKGIVSPLYAVYKPFNVNPQYIEQYFSLDSRLNSYLLPLINKGAKNTINISDTTALEGLIILPNLLEQEKIVELFTYINKSILFTEKELNRLKKLKEASLQRLFPQPGESVPQLRFKGFTEPWQEKKLGEYLDIDVHRNIGEIYGIQDVLSVSGDYGVVNQIEFQGRSFAGDSLVNYKVTHPNQIIYTKSPLKAQPFGIVKNNQYGIGIISPLYAVYNPKENVYADFIHYYFSLIPRLNNYLRPLINKGAKNTLLISDEMALQGMVIFPPSLEEQKAIGEYFRNLDKMISAKRKKLEKLKQIKASCLNLMFV